MSEYLTKHLIIALICIYLPALSFCAMTLNTATEPMNKTAL